MFDFTLPAHLIAQHPCERRDQARLLVVRRDAGALSHHRFADLPALLEPGDLLVLNDTRVLPARLLGQREATGGKWEGLFLREHEHGTWEMLCQTRGKLQIGEWVRVESGALRLQVLQKQDDVAWLMQPDAAGSAVELLSQWGHVPLPPYIRKGIAAEEDRERYQTVYAHEAGAVAAPTAGLHFTPEVLARIEERDISCRYVTLHVGWGTFQPMSDADPKKHVMHHEWAALPQETVTAIEACRQRGGKVVAVGTTTVRVLESAAARGPLRAWSGETDLFIYPPYEFQVVDALVTNFHLPKTTLLLLVSALVGEELLQEAYQTAIAEAYRFYSYGDAMLIL